MSLFNVHVAGFSASGWAGLKNICSQDSRNHFLLMEDETQESSHRLIGDLGDRLLSKNTCPENVNYLSWYVAILLCIWIFFFTNFTTRSPLLFYPKIIFVSLKNYQKKLKKKLRWNKCVASFFYEDADFHLIHSLFLEFPSSFYNLAESNSLVRVMNIKPTRVPKKV